MSMNINASNIFSKLGKAVPTERKYLLLCCSDNEGEISLWLAAVLSKMIDKDKQIIKIFLSKICIFHNLQLLL